MDLDALIAALGGLVLERRERGRFAVVGAAPAWCRLLDAPSLSGAEPFELAAVFPFLGTFLDDAERAWRADGEPTRSGYFTEVVAERRVLHLDALALRVGEAELLIVWRDEARFAQQQQLLQRAREVRLAHDALIREIEQKDVLLHAVVYELAAPLHRVLGTLSLLREHVVKGQSAAWVHEVHDELLRQRQTVTAVLEAFSAELRAGPSLTPVDLRAPMKAAIDTLAPVAERRGVHVEYEPPPEPCVSRVDERRVSRVLEHLVGDAVYGSAAGGAVRVALRAEAGWCWIDVEDARPPLPLEVVHRLFQRLSAVGAGEGSSGIGLYFCRIHVERWGGGIGCEASYSGGRRLWLRLPEVQEGAR